MGFLVWERGVPIIAAIGHDLTPRSVVAPLAWQVTLPAGPAPVAGPHSS